MKIFGDVLMLVGEVEKCVLFYFIFDIELFFVFYFMLKYIVYWEFMWWISLNKIWFCFIDLILFIFRIFFGLEKVIEYGVWSFRVGSSVRFYGGGEKNK